MSRPRAGILNARRARLPGLARPWVRGLSAASRFENSLPELAAPAPARRMKPAADEEWGKTRSSRLSATGPSGRPHPRPTTTVSTACDGLEQHTHRVHSSLRGRVGWWLVRRCLAAPGRESPPPAGSGDQTRRWARRGPSCPAGPRSEGGKPGGASTSSRNTGTRVPRRLASEASLRTHSEAAEAALHNTGMQRAPLSACSPLVIGAGQRDFAVPPYRPAALLESQREHPGTFAILAGVADEDAFMASAACKCTIHHFLRLFWSRFMCLSVVRCTHFPSRLTKNAPSAAVASACTGASQSCELSSTC